MCTVSYLPTGSGTYILTSNRDESPARHGKGILADRKGGSDLYYPEVPDTPGSWICLSDTGKSVCLLNGAFGRIPYDRPFPRSRGNVILDFFEYESTEAFAGSYAMAGLAPFTLVVLEFGRCFQLIWDDSEVLFEERDAGQPHFWSSATLYEPEVRAWRESLFRDWLQGRDRYTQKDILDFHTSGGAGDPRNGLLMNRDDLVKTLSVTSIRRERERVELLYRDLQKEQPEEQKIFLPHVEDYG